MRIFITGSTGILGRHVCDFIKKYKPDAQVFRNTVDIMDSKSVLDLVASVGSIDLVIHLAALVPIAQVKEAPEKAYEVNVGGTINLLNALIGQDAKFIYCSTGHVYSSSTDQICEDTPANPLSLYGRTKRIGEIIATDVADARGFPLCIPRVFSIHDPQQSGSFLRPNLERRFAEEDLTKPFELFGAHSTRDFLTAREAARRLVLLAFSDACGPVNVASGTGTLISDFAQSLSPVPLKIIPLGEPDIMVADIKRLQKYLGKNLLLGE